MSLRILPITLILLIAQVYGQGTRCQTKTDCKDKWNPYCSKWGYCISYDAYGENGPGQSKGAVEDGHRGQCRDDSDCTPHTPNCSPEGYCSAGLFSKTNYNAGFPNVLKSAIHYEAIEDANRQGHVESRKEDPLFQERPDLLANVEAVENTVYKPCTYCKYDPETGLELPTVQQVPQVSPPLSNTITEEGDEPQFLVDQNNYQVQQNVLSYQPAVPYEPVPNLPEVSDIDTNIHPSHNEVQPPIFDTLSGIKNDIENSIHQPTKLGQNIPQTQSINPYNILQSFPAATSHSLPSSPVPALPSQTPEPRVQTNTLSDIRNDLVNSLHQPTKLGQNIPQPQPINPYNTLPAFQASPSPSLPASPISALPSPTPEPRVQALPDIIKPTNIEPQYSAAKPINPFNPFQSPQYQTGRATSIHQQTPQYQIGNPYNFPSYPIFQYPIWGANPYFQNRYSFG